MEIIKIKLPPHLSKLTYTNWYIVGGEARVFLSCLIQKTPYPQQYKPRDKDYLVEVGRGSGIVDNVGCVGFDILLVSSLEDYFAEIDLYSNQVAVKDGILYTTMKCLECFVKGKVQINPNHSKITKNGRNGWQYLALRACIQSGYDIEGGDYLPRQSALKLSKAISTGLNPCFIQHHWYYPTYQWKLTQIKNGNH